MPTPVRDSEEEIQTLLQEARHSLPHNPLHAIALAERAERLAEEREDEPNLASSLVIQGRAWFRQSRWEEARESFLAVLSWARHLGDPRLEWEALHLLGQTASRQQEIPTALEWLFRALETLSPLQDPSGESEVRSTIGATYGLAGRYREAGEELQEALRLARASGRDATILPALGNTAKLLEVSGNLTLARSRYEETLELARRCNHQVFVAQTHSSLCRVLSLLGEFDRAQEHGERAITTADSLNHPHQRVLARRALGDAYAELGALEEAERWLMAGLELAEGEAMRTEWAELLHALGRVSARQGELSLAKQYHEAALTQAVENGSVADQAREHRMLAELCENEGDLPGAIHHLKAQIQAEEFVQRQAAQGEFLAAMARLEWEKSQTETD